MDKKLPAFFSRTLFHTGVQIIREPDIRIGRKNADFGQGFYLSNDEDFSRRWARTGKDVTAYLNRYEMDYDGLKIKRFERSQEWFDYIFDNRAGHPDALKDYDIIIGPIANDTLYDTGGIITSGLINRQQAFRMLSVGPAYEQIVIKTDRAAERLRFAEALEISQSEVEGYRAIVREEEKRFLEQSAEVLIKLM